MNVMFLFLEVTDVFKFKCVVYRTFFFNLGSAYNFPVYHLFIFPCVVSKPKD